ncbi:MAG: endonuclease III [Candidatus Omnitrophota bacterium]
MDKKEANRIYGVLEREYPGVSTALKYKGPMELLVATVLSAQCTDKRVNIVTSELFKKYRTIEDYADADVRDFEADIRSTGFYKNKAKNIIAAAGMILKDFGGVVPRTMEDLVALPGVARKTANIIMFHAYGKNEGVAVDTHVRRVSGRLGFTKNTDPVKIEKDLMEIFDRKRWGHFSNTLIEHGRMVCVARKPLCVRCPVRKLCSSSKSFYPS